MAKERKEATVDSAVPRQVLDSLLETQASAENLKEDLLQFLSAADPDALAELPPLQRARAFLTLAKSATALLSVRLRCGGICPDDHPIRTEIERLSLYEEKLSRCNEWSKAPLRPSATVNQQAASRFIGHSLPDLTLEQRQGMREISRRGGLRSKHSENRRAQKKLKCQDPGRLSVRAAAQEFLEKAARELRGSSDPEVKGPLRMETSDEED